MHPASAGRPQGAGGPVPAPDPRVWADPTRRRVLAVLAAHPGPVPLGTVVEEVGGHPNTARGHLDALRDAGLVDRASGPRSGRGRPPSVHGLTEVGRSVVRRLGRTGPGSGADAGLDLDGLALAFVRHLRTLPDPSGTAREVGRSWAGSLPPATRARTPGGRARAVVDLLDGMGFTPVRVSGSVEPGGPGGENDAGPVARTDEIELRSCPLLESATAHPEVVCQIHLGLVEGALHQDGSEESVHVQLEPWGRPQGCRLLLTWPVDRGRPPR